jgi:hypothetical protein
VELCAPAVGLEERAAPRHRVQMGLHEAIHHIDALRTIDKSLDLARSHFYEFGAGWDLLVPLSYYVFGVERQTLVDIRRNVRLDS